MGCFLACFRFGGNERNRASLQSSSTKTSEHFVSKGQLSSLFLSEDNDPPDQGNYCQSSIDRELKHEVKFLKACGTLLETPAEIRKASQKINVHNQDQECLSSKFQSLPLDESFKTIQRDEQIDPPGISHLFVNDQSDISVCRSVRCATKEPQGGDNLSLLSSEPSNADSQCQIKSIHFEGTNNDIKYQSVLDSAFHGSSTSQIGHQKKFLEFKEFPYPTPLKLTDEMQTPGTIYLKNLNTPETMKYGHARSQYVYAVPGSVVNTQEMKTLNDSYQPCESDFLLDKHSSQPQGSSSTNENSFKNEHISNENSPSFWTPCNAVTRQNMEGPRSFAKDQEEHIVPEVVVSSLSQWLKPPLPEEERKRIREAAMKDASPSGKSTDEDRPIIGIVAAHWNDEESSNISPKWWDGNGIPNSTNKYKEDQKVSWHATPFEERLEKALSDDSHLPGRNLKAKPINFCEEEESDTAAS